MTDFTAPSPDTVAALFKQAMKKEAVFIKRFSSGMAHDVYDIADDYGHYVMRIAAPHAADRLKDALYWHGKLKPLGLPLPSVLYADIAADPLPYAFYITERFDGRPFADVCMNMSLVKKDKLAEQITHLQNIVRDNIPPAQTCGRYPSPDHAAADDPSWTAYAGDFSTKRKRLKDGGLFSPYYADILEEEFYKHRAYMDAVLPLPFLEDLQAKNIIIDDNNDLAGIVDIDGMTYGDGIFHIGRTRMTLLSGGYDKPDYTDRLCKYAGLDDDGFEALRLYTLSSCVALMSETGRSFSPGDSPTDSARIRFLKETFDRFMKKHARFSFATLCHKILPFTRG